ncbi:MAG: 30S ribosomal protein S10 [Deltaproteobacteria bacterium]|nr:30S ribosomal protein S10 [Deltaproteobacteria bacterium]
MGDNKMRVRLCGYDRKVLDVAVAEIVEVIKRTGGKVAGPIPLPTKVARFTVNRSPHVDKKARDQFELAAHCRILDILEATPQTMDDLTKLEIPAGVDVGIRKPKNSKRSSNLVNNKNKKTKK